MRSFRPHPLRFRSQHPGPQPLCNHRHRHRRFRVHLGLLFRPLSQRSHRKECHARGIFLAWLAHQIFRRPALPSLRSHRLPVCSLPGAPPHTLGNTWKFKCKKLFEYLFKYRLEHRGMFSPHLGGVSLQYLVHAAGENPGHRPDGVRAHWCLIKLPKQSSFK